MTTWDDAARETGFSGVIRVGDEVAAYGFADRAHRIPMTPRTRLAIASGSKGFTALAVMSLVEDGALSLSTPARALLGADLPLIADDVTIEHLLGHRSGIEDYLDDDRPVEDYLMPVPVCDLATTEAFVPILDGHPAMFAAGERFHYCNGGFVVLALIAERASGTGYHDLVRQRVLAPAGMIDSDFLRSDELPGDAAVHYVGESRSNVFHLPVLGNGDGGCYTTAGDMHRFWAALFAGDIVRPATFAAMIEPRSFDPGNDRRYGLGFWLGKSDSSVLLEGYDAGVSFRSGHDPATGRTYSILGNTSDGAWAIVGSLSSLLP